MKELSPGTVVFGVFAILAGLLTAYGVRKSLEKPAPEAVAEAPAPKVKTVKIVVPVKNLSEYALITPEDVTEVEIPEADFPKDYVGKVLPNKERAHFRVVKKTILSNTPLTEDSLYEIGNVPSIGERLNEGETALTLKIATLNANNGMVRPDSRVNILLTFDKEKVANMEKLNNLGSVTLMKNVRVLSTSYSRLPSEESTNEITNITFAVTSLQANKLNVAEKYGDLTVTLCSDANEGDDLLDSPEDFVDPYSLLGLDLPAAPGPAQVELSAKKYTDNWSDGSRTGGRVFQEWEVLESLNATRVAKGDAPLRRVPRELASIDNIPEDLPTPVQSMSNGGKVVSVRDNDREVPAPTAKPAEENPAANEKANANQASNVLFQNELVPAA